MNIEINDKLDVLIALSAKDCGNDDVEIFRSLDTSDINLGKDFYAKQRRTINKYERKTTVTLLRKCLIRVAVALMALMSVGFLTVMAVPDIREAVFEAVVEWYDNYVSIRFEPSGGDNNQPTDTTSSTTSSITTSSSGIHGESDSSNIAITPPTIIEKVMKPTYIPKGAEEDIVADNKTMVVIDYYTNNDELYYSYIQIVFKNNSMLFDNDSVVIDETIINGHSALILEYGNKEGNIVVWTDGSYYFQLLSRSLSVEELIAIALGVQ